MSKPIKASFEVDFEPVGRRVRIGAEETILEAARAAGVQLASMCGGAGLCESCIIRLGRGELSSLSLAEESAREQGWLAENERLACQALPLGDVTIDVPPKSFTTSQRLQLEATTNRVALDPVVAAITVRVEYDQDGIEEAEYQLLQALKKNAVEQAWLGDDLKPDLLATLAQSDGDVRVVIYGEEILTILAPDQPMLGLAVDVGTTKLALYLLNLENGETLAKVGAMNPQISYGEDVISRISYANQGESERQELSRILISRLNEAIDELCSIAGCSRTAIVDAVVVGNTVMHHTFLSLSLHQLGVAPFAAAETEAQVVRAKALGIDLAEGASIYLPPVIAGYVGADHTATLLATDFQTPNRGVMVIDIGTNTELSLQVNDVILTCSCASGPAFEGAHIRDGMRAAPGAIERVQSANGGLRWQTIDDVPPVGICGSGILDAISSLRSLGWVDRSGRISSASISPDYLHSDGICLVRADESGHGSEILITRDDIHEIQLAQGAIRAGIEVLLAEAGLRSADLSQIYLAGAFGTYLDPTSAVNLGMLPDVEVRRILQVGNAAGEGARQLLLSGQKRIEVDEMLARVSYIELTTHVAFPDLYMKYLFLG